MQFMFIHVQYLSGHLFSVNLSINLILCFPSNRHHDSKLYLGSCYLMSFHCLGPRCIYDIYVYYVISICSRVTHLYMKLFLMNH